MDVDMVLGDLNAPMDYVPDVGHGTIQPFTDLPWLSEIARGGRDAGRWVDRRHPRARHAGPDPGRVPRARRVRHERAEAAAWSRSRSTSPSTCPTAFGAIEGTVNDAHTGDPIAGATVVVHATWHGRSARPRRDDRRRRRLPDRRPGRDLAGRRHGHRLRHRSTPDVTIVERRDDAAGSTSPSTSTSRTPRSTAGPFTFVLTPGRTGDGTITRRQPRRPRAASPSPSARSTSAAPPRRRSAGTGRGGGCPPGPARRAPTRARGRPAALGCDGACRPARAARDRRRRSPRGRPGCPARGASASPATSGSAASSTTARSAVTPARARTPSSTSPATRPATRSRRPGRPTFNADMAWDKNHGLLWQVNVDGDNGIYGLDPADGSVKNDDHRLARGRTSASAAWPTTRPPTRSTSAAGTRASSTTSPGSTARPRARRSASAPPTIRTSPVSPGTRRSDGSGWPRTPTPTRST